ncbi:MAG: cupin domain-containing protein [Rhodospirillales bacterium]|nr:MAG: cupin domain-containing protein [Rhodospirillales bacterium]
MTKMRLAGPADGERLDVLGAAMIVKTDPGGDGVFVADHSVPPGYFVPPHAHDDDDETLMVVDGALTLLGPAGSVVAGAGSCAHLPRGSVHGFRNDTSSPVRVLVIARPGLQAAEMFRHLDRAGRAAPGGLTPPEIGDICGQYGVRMA